MRHSRSYPASLAYGVGDVVIWDNASLLHSATLVDPAHARTLVAHHHQGACARRSRDRRARADLRRHDGDVACGAPQPQAARRPQPRGRDDEPHHRRHRAAILRRSLTRAVTAAPNVERCSTIFPPVDDLSATQRCFEVLELLAGEADGLALTSIGRALGLPKSATHRLLLTLVDAGYAIQDEASQRYRLTLKIATLGFRLLAASTVQDVCQPTLERIAAASGDLARLAVVDGDGLRWVAKAQGAHVGLRYDPEMGLEVALHATAVGRLWLATLPESRAIAIVERYRRTATRPLGPMRPGRWPPSWRRSAMPGAVPTPRRWRRAPRASARSAR